MTPTPAQTAYLRQLREELAEEELAEEALAYEPPRKTARRRAVLVRRR